MKRAGAIVFIILGLGLGLGAARAQSFLADCENTLPSQLVRGAVA